MTIRMHELLSESGGVLAGVPNGRKAFGRLMELTTTEPPQPTTLFLDFGRVDVATGSFLRESVLAFRDAIRGQRSNFYPVVANADASIVDEFRVVLAPRRDVLLFCSLDGDERPGDIRLEGTLDPKQQLTFDLVNLLKDTSARELMEGHQDAEDVTQTAWNNRLAALAGLGLIVELSHGRSKRYRPVLMGN